MGATERLDDPAFRASLGGDAGVKLREPLRDKLKEFMDDCCDDTLVDYVVVLLRNGRSKDDITSELDVFLSEDSKSFVTWLWDHLASNIEQYLQSQLSDEVVRGKPPLVDHGGQNDSPRLHPDSGKGKCLKRSSSRHNREWKGIFTDAAEHRPFRYFETDDIQNEEKSHCLVTQSRQSVSPVRKKRSHPDDLPRAKGEVTRAKIQAPRRLLQFAVRDAVATSKTSSSLLEPAQKRLRSVVSTMTEDTVPPLRIQSVATVPNAMATAIKAVAEAAEDVRKVKQTGNVFDRLSRDTDVSPNAEQVSRFRGPLIEDVNYGSYDQALVKTHASYLHKGGYEGKYGGNLSVVEDSGLASDSASDIEGYDDITIRGRRRMDVYPTGASGGNECEDSTVVQCSVPQNADDRVHQARMRDHDPVVSVANTSDKVVNISVNVNTWKLPHYHPQSEIVDIDSQKSLQESNIGTGRSFERVMKENSNPLTANGNTKPAADSRSDIQKTLTTSAPGSHSAGRPMEEADSRTIFVNNVHFAATTDGLSRHFNKFGDVLKVIILNDAATGQPKGSAYVEFMLKEAAENALSLDGTSFMSRIIKVVKKSSTQQEANSMMTRPRIARGPPFSVPRFARAPFPRVFPSVYRARPPIRAGARSLQWKRDAQQTSSESIASAAGNSISVPRAAGRGLTYVRTESKPDGNRGAV